MAATYHFVTLLGLALVGCSMAQWHRSQFTNPQDTTQDKDFCGRKGRKSSICDPNQRLTYTQANQLDNTIHKILNETKCPCSEYLCKRDPRGYHVGVAIAPKILSDEEMREYSDGNEDSYEKEYSPRTRLHHTELFAFTLLRNWKLGKCEDDIIIVFDPENFSLFTVGGKTSLRLLTPEIIGDITMVNREEFAKGPFEGLQRVLSDYRTVLLGHYEGQPVYSSRPKTAAVVSGASSVIPVSTLSLLSVLLYALW